VLDRKPSEFENLDVQYPCTPLFACPIDSGWSPSIEKHRRNRWV